MSTIETPRLGLVSATPDMLRAEMCERAQLGAVLGVAIPSSWPPQYNDLSTMQYMLDLIERDAANRGWGYYYVLRHGSPGEHGLIGGCGFKGKPDVSGVVEIGYSLLSEHQGRGYGTELVAGLVGYAFASATVSMVIAETLPPLIASIRVLEKNGFVYGGVGAEPASIRFTRVRATSG